MDTRSLIALGMILAVVTVGLVKGVMDGPTVKELLIILGSGIVGSLVPRAPARFRHGDTPAPGDLPAGHSGSNRITAT